MDALAYWIVINTDVADWNHGRWFVRMLIDRAAAHVATHEQQ